MNTTQWLEQHRVVRGLLTITYLLIVPIGTLSAVYVADALAEKLGLNERPIVCIEAAHGNVICGKEASERQ